MHRSLSFLSKSSWLGESFYSEVLLFCVKLLNKEINSVLVEEHLFLRHTFILLGRQSVSTSPCSGTWQTWWDGMGWDGGTFWFCATLQQVLLHYLAAHYKNMSLAICFLWLESSHSSRLKSSHAKVTFWKKWLLSTLTLCSCRPSAVCPLTRSSFELFWSSLFFTYGLFCPTFSDFTDKEGLEGAGRVVPPQTLNNSIIRLRNDLMIE